MTSASKPQPATAVPPARTPAEAAERLRAAGYRVRRRARRKRGMVVDLPSLLPYLFTEHGPQTTPTE
jgi:hypothetical protein